MTNMNRVLNALKSGEKLTGKQIRARFGVANPRATISDLRMNGYPIYSNKHVDTKGRVTHKYRLGSASREVIAAGYKALAQGLV